MAQNLIFMIEIWHTISLLHALWCKLQSSSCVSRIPRQSTIVLFWFVLYGGPVQPTSGRSLTTLTKFYPILTTYPSSNGQLWTTIYSLFTWPSVDFLLTTYLPLIVYVVIEWSTRRPHIQQTPLFFWYNCKRGLLFNSMQKGTFASKRAITYNFTAPTTYSIHLVHMTGFTQD